MRLPNRSSRSSSVSRCETEIDKAGPRAAVADAAQATFPLEGAAVLMGQDTRFDLLVPQTQVGCALLGEGSNLRASLAETRFRTFATGEAARMPFPIAASADRSSGLTPL